MQQMPRYEGRFARADPCLGPKLNVSEYATHEGGLAMVLSCRGEPKGERQKVQARALVVNSKKPTTGTEALRPRTEELKDQQAGDSVVEVLGFAEALERLCTTRLHGDITDTSYTPREARKRVLRGGERLHNALEVVEIVRHRECDQDNDGDDSDEEEEEAIQRKANLSSLERCLVWVELHHFVDERNSDISAPCSGS